MTLLISWNASRDQRIKTTDASVERSNVSPGCMETLLSSSHSRPCAEIFQFFGRLRTNLQHYSFNKCRPSFPPWSQDFVCHAQTFRKAPIYLFSTLLVWMQFKERRLIFLICLENGQRSRLMLYQSKPAGQTTLKYSSSHFLQTTPAY